MPGSPARPNPILPIPPGLGILTPALPGSGRISRIELFDPARLLLQVLSHTEPTIPYCRVSGAFGELSIPSSQFSQLARIGHGERIRGGAKPTIKKGLREAFDPSQQVHNSECSLLALIPVADDRFSRG